MNQCLLTKWVSKIEKGSNDLWFKLLKAKYMQHSNFFGSEVKGSSQFWKGLHTVKHFLKCGAEYRVFKGNKARFWHDSWVGGMPLSVCYKLS
jgi:hypothetical protein